eukprot:8264454-Alexandrium_andersonii.AAC.1
MLVETLREDAQHSPLAAEAAAPTGVSGIEPATAAVPPRLRRGVDRSRRRPGQPSRRWSCVTKGSAA